MTTANRNETSPADRPVAAPGGPSSWVLDPAGTTAEFSNKSMWGLVTVRGTFSQVAGSGETLADGSGRGRLEIGAASLDTKNRKRDDHLRSADFFSAAEHPLIVVDITRANPVNSGSAEASGTLTIAGTVRPLAVTAKVTEATDRAVTLAAEADVDRADFGMTWNRASMLTGKAHVSVVARFVKAG
jgi:polyisoprenoid-binding protein YceI